MTPSGKALIASISTLGLVGLVIVVMSLAGLKPPGVAGVIFAGLGLLLMAMVPVMSLFVMSQSPHLREGSEGEQAQSDKVVYTPASFRPAGKRSEAPVEKMDTPFPVPPPPQDVFATQDSRMLIENIGGMRSDLVVVDTGALKRPNPADIEALFKDDIVDLGEYLQPAARADSSGAFDDAATHEISRSRSQIAVRRALESGMLPSPFEDISDRMAARPPSMVIGRAPSVSERSLEERTRDATGLSQDDPFSENPTELMSRDVVEVLRSASSSDIKAVSASPALLDDLLEDGPDPWGLEPTRYDLDREVERVKKDFLKEQVGAPDSGMMKIARFLDDLSGDEDAGTWRALATDSVEIPARKVEHKKRDPRRKTLSGGFKSNAPFTKKEASDEVVSQESVIVFLGVGDIGEGRPDALKHSPDDESTNDLNPLSETDF